MAGPRLSVKGITKLAKLQLSSLPQHHHSHTSLSRITMLKVKLIFNLFGLLTGEFNYAVPPILPGTTVVVETTLAYPPVAVNFQVFVNPPTPEIELV